MKVNVLQVADATFKKFCFWSDWIDVAVYNCLSTPYLIQMKISRVNGKKFRSINIVGRFAFTSSTAEAVGDLTQMSREKNND